MTSHLGCATDHQVLPQLDVLRRANQRAMTAETVVLPQQGHTDEDTNNKIAECIDEAQDEVESLCPSSHIVNTRQVQLLVVVRTFVNLTHVSPRRWQSIGMSIACCRRRHDASKTAVPWGL